MYDGYVGDTSYAELMKGVDYSEDDLQRVLDRSNSKASVEDVKKHDLQWKPTIEAKTRSFIRKQASRGHWGIWEHPQITFSVKGMSVVTERQLTRHRHMSFDVQSMRYVDFSDDVGVPTPRSMTDPDHFTREDGHVELSERTRDRMQAVYERQVDQSIEAYENMVAAGVPKEDARYVLPLGTTVNVTMSGNARTMLHVLNLRQRGNAQWEIRDLSEQVVEELRDWIPYTAEWWDEKGPVQISP